MTAALTLMGVHQRLGGNHVLRGIDLTVLAGQRIGIIGPNGAGKSTLFDVISGRQAPSQGQVWLGDKRIDGQPPHLVNRLGLSRSFQVSHVFGHLSVFDNVRCAVLWRLGHGYSFWRRLSGLTDANALAADVLQQVQLLAKQHTLAGQLTYAEQRALELGMTLASGAPVILLDEPTAGMSQSESRQFTELIRRVTQGKTLLIVEHDMTAVFGLADKIAVMVQGELLAFDTPAAVRANAQVQAAYLGVDAVAKVGD